MRNISFKSFDKFSYNHRERNTDKNIHGSWYSTAQPEQRLCNNAFCSRCLGIYCDDCLLVTVYRVLFKGITYQEMFMATGGDAVLLSRICNCKGVNRQHFLILCISKICNCAHTYIITTSRILSCVCYVITSNILSVTLPMKLSSKIEKSSLFW